MSQANPRSILVTGATGQLGQGLVPALEAAGWWVVAAGSDIMDVRDHDVMQGAITTLRPDAVVNLAAWTDVDGAEDRPGDAFAVNAVGARTIAQACHRAGSHLLHVSSDYVFDGRATTPYDEWSGTGPLSVYGRSKLAGEVEAWGAAGATVVRTAWLSGAHGQNIVRTLLRLGSEPGRTLTFVDDQVGSPTVVDDLVPVLLRLLDERSPGLFHATNAGAASWFDLARHVFESAGHDPERIQPVTTAQLVPAQAAERPRFSVLDNAALDRAGHPPMAHWTDAVTRLVQHLTT